ncbi:hypothetical protein [Sphingomonas soli]|uniref:hypothetical protein n=1 Tax=Sphingomonas soli TaxID=266127 RepID=UPI00082B8B3E|nr:hypothetical protein [Sphingomonas soli]
MRIKIYVCDKKADLDFAIGDVPDGSILYQTPDGEPDTGDAVGYTVANGVKSPVKKYTTFTNKYVLVARI